MLGGGYGQLPAGSAIFSSRFAQYLALAALCHAKRNRERIAPRQRQLPVKQPDSGRQGKKNRLPTRAKYPVVSIGSCLAISLRKEPTQHEESQPHVLQRQTGSRLVAGYLGRSGLDRGTFHAQPDQVT